MQLIKKYKMNISNKTLVIGPSHILRILHQIKYSILPTLPENIVLFGNAGMPIWHPMIEEHLNNNEYDQILVIVGDFRFGNKIFKGLPNDKIFGIDRELINYENDQTLLEKSLVALRYLVNTYEGVRLLFWDLIIREWRNIINQKYYTNQGIYSHPTWNYNEISKEFEPFIISINFLMKQTKDIITIDSSNHPSIYGYLILYKAIQMTRKKEFNESMENFFTTAKEIFLRKINSLPLVNTLLVCDDSICRYLTKNFNNESLPKIDDLQIISIEKIKRHEKAYLSKTFESVMYLSSYSFEEERALNEYKEIVEKIDIIKKFRGKSHVFLFSYYAKNITELRKKAKKHRHKIPNKETPYELKSLEMLIPTSLNILDSGMHFFNSLYELTPSNFSFKGYLYLYYISIIGYHENIEKDFDLFYSFFINDFFNEIGLDY